MTLEVTDNMSFRNHTGVSVEMCYVLNINKNTSVGICANKYELKTQNMEKSKNDSVHYFNGLK